MARSGRYSIIISWYNTIGGLEVFNFQARKSYGWTIGKVEKSQRDVFASWEDNFTNADQDIDITSIKANERVIVRSQNLSLQQINAISQIKISPRVKDEDRGIVVDVDRNSFNYRTDHDKRHEISFTITYPDQIIPTL